MRSRTAFAVILAAALALRLWGLGFGLPYAYHQDEPIVVNHALAIGATGWDTGRYMPPQFASYLLFLLYGAFFALGKFTGLFKDSTDFA
ncbi:MAG TPA: phospholipid carrier-dependent glycosyltransferase, partial [Candidatus Eisenbacteria bacterium]|nr:phospholipid carrier-dependent glycosyltransferase [Candidatus Eisenbacteria bacterium]